MCDLDTPLNGLLLHADTLCILRNNYHEDLQESGEDGQETNQEEDEEAEQRYYRRECRYYRQTPDDEAEAREAPGGGTTAATSTAATSGTTASSRTGSTAGGTARATGASPKATVSNGTCRVSTTYYRQHREEIKYKFQRYYRQRPAVLPPPPGAVLPPPPAVLPLRRQEFGLKAHVTSLSYPFVH